MAVSMAWCRGGAEVQFLTDYAADLKPTERMWSKIKSLLCSAGDTNTQKLDQAHQSGLLKTHAQR